MEVLRMPPKYTGCPWAPPKSTKGIRGKLCIIPNEGYQWQLYEVFIEELKESYINFYWRKITKERMSKVI